MTGWATRGRVVWWGMSKVAGQGSLFGSAEPALDPVESARTLAWMREQVAWLQGTSVPPWAREMEMYVCLGAFTRAVRRVPEAEGAALFEAFDREVERLCAVWDDAAEEKG